MAGPGGPIVGRVRLRVAPDVSGFRREVEKQMAGLRDAEVDVNPNMTGFRDKVRAATRNLRATVNTNLDTSGLRGKAAAAARAASGQDVEFDTELRTRDLNRSARRAAKLASGHSIEFQSVLTTRFTNPNIGFRRELPGLRKDLEFIRDLAASVTVDPLRRSAQRSQTVIRGVGNGITRISRATKNIGTSFASGMTRTARGLGRMLRDAVSPLLLLGQTARWGTGGLIAERKMAQGLGYIRRKVIEVGSTVTRRMAKPFRAMSRQFISDGREIRAELGRMNVQFREMRSGAGAALREEGAKLGNFLGAPIRRVRQKIQPLTDELGRMRDQMREAWIGAGDVAREQSQVISRSMKRVNDSFRNSPAGRELDRMKQRITEVRRTYSQFRKTASEQGITGPGRRLYESTERVRQAFRATRGIVRDLSNNIRTANGATSRMAQSAGGARRAFAQMPKMAERSGQSAAKRFWRKFHQPENRIFGMTEMGWMATAITGLIAPLSGGIGAALAAIPALGAAAVAALSAVVMGWEGVTDAAQAAAPAFERMQDAMSDVFRTRMTPQFEQLGGFLDQVRGQMVGVAEGITDMTGGFVDALTSSSGVEKSQAILERSGELFSSLAPWVENVTDGLLTLGAAGAETFPKLSEGLNRAGESFRNNMQSMFEDGSLQAGIESLYDILGSLGSNISKIIGAGFRELPNLTDGLTGAFDGLGDGLTRAMPMLTSFSNALLGIIEDLGPRLGNLAEGLKPTFDSLVDSLGPALSNLLDGVGDLGGQLFQPLADFATGVAPAVGEIFTGLGTDLENAANNLSTYAPEIETNMTRIGEALGNLGTISMDEGGGFLEGLFGAELISESDAELLSRGLDFVATELEQFGVDIENAVRGVQERINNIKEFFGFEVEPIEMDIEVEPNLKVNPNIDMEGALTELTGSMTGPIADLDAAIQQFKANAEEIASAAEIDISPQIKVLEEATDLAEFSAAARGILDTIQGTMEPEQVEMEVDPQVQISDEAAGISEGVKEQLSGALEGLGPELSTMVEGQVSEAMTTVDTSISEAVSTIGLSIGEAMGGVEIPTEGLSTAINTALDGVSTTITTRASELGTTATSELNNIFSGVTVDVSPIETSISSGLDTAITTAFSGAAATAQSSAEQIVTSATDGLSGLASEFEGKGTEAGQSLATAIGAQEGTVSTEAGKLKTAATNAVSDIDVSASGAAVGQTFAAGIRSSIRDVRTAASELAAAAREYFPNSPADAGPFSGSGWIDKSGIAVGREFAEGMASQQGVVAGAAHDLMASAQRQFDEFSLNPAASLEEFHRDQILQPVLEANARKIHSWREREADSAERLNERIAKINESNQDQAKKEERIAEAREQAAERSAESREKLLESLERPYYEDIDRSFQSYYVDGMRKVLRDGLSQAVEDARLVDVTRDVANAAVREGRKAFGDLAVFDVIDFNVNADHFERTIQRVIDEAGIAEIPINFAVSNLEQLKSDLGMGDGVISRALDQAMTVDPAATDARYHRQNPVEIHYHVADMEEAIRLEQMRERKEMMKH